MFAVADSRLRRGLGVLGARGAGLDSWLWFRDMIAEGTAVSKTFRGEENPMLELGGLNVGNI